MHAFRRYLETSLGHQSQARARDMSSCCHLCRWRRFIVTLSVSHVFPGEIVDMRGLGSALAVAMMVAGRGDPTLAALRSRLDACTGVGACSLVSVQLFSGRGVHALR